MLGKPARGSAPLRGCYRKGLTPSSLWASALQAGMAETAIRPLSKTRYGCYLLEGFDLSHSEKIFERGAGK
jgi:hypothetical protein